MNQGRNFLSASRFSSFPRLSNARICFFCDFSFPEFKFAYANFLRVFNVHLSSSLEGYVVLPPRNQTFTWPKRVVFLKDLACSDVFQYEKTSSLLAVFNRVHQYMDIQNMPWGRGEYQEETFNFISGFSFVLGRKKVPYHDRSKFW